MNTASTPAADTLVEAIHLGGPILSGEAPAAETSAAGEWTAEKLLKLVDDNYAHPALRKVAQDIDASLATLREQLAQAELLDNKIADELESWQLRAQTAEAALATAQQERDEAREQWRLFRIAADKAIARAEAAEDACRLKDEALSDLLHHGLQYENGEIHQADPEAAKRALAAAQPSASALQTVDKNS